MYKILMAIAVVSLLVVIGGCRSNAGVEAGFDTSHNHHGVNAGVELGVGGHTHE